MNFVSYEFLIFIGVVLTLYHQVGHRLQNQLLLVGSYVFYGWWDWRFLGLILLSTVVDFFCALAVDPERHPERSQRARKGILWISLGVNLGVLAFFKYFDFFRDSAVRAAASFDVALDVPTLSIILPVGISFYTFQTLSYTIDVYRGKLASTERFADFMLYVSFFPQLVAGPIERGVSLLPQILAPRVVTAERMHSGAMLALVGFFKKIVIADNMALLVNDVFIEPSPPGAMVVLATYAFAIQIYCDFSGYTDIARGVARMLGFELCLNFRLPYLATNPSDFWQRWHISLSSWLRDYLYIPLGGNRGGWWRTYRNLALTMLLGGLWHGASWHFVVWGAYHGLLLVAYRLVQDRRQAKAVTHERRRGWRFALSVAFFFQLTCVGWLIFRVPSMARLWVLIDAMRDGMELDAAGLYALVSIGMVAVPLLVFQLYQYYSDELEPWRHWPAWLRVAFCVVLYFGISLFGAEVRNEFIYFQF